MDQLQLPDEDLVKPRTVALLAAAVALAGALVLLLVRVQATPDYALSPADRAEAESLHQKVDRARPTPRAANTPRFPGRTPAVPRRAPRPRPDRAPEATPPAVGPGWAAKRPSADGARAAAGRGTALRQKMSEARRLYDDRLYPEARTMALEVLESSPKNIRMLRIVVSASCLMGEPEQARQHIVELPLRDQLQMRKKCAKYGSPLHREKDSAE